MKTDHPFEAAIRRHHAASLEHLSPRVRAQLQQRRRAALAGQRAGEDRGARTPWRFALPLAAACAVGALAIGLNLRAPEPAAPAVATTTPAPAAALPAPGTVAAVAAVANAAADTDDASAGATLEENPDLYVWLASSDADALVAME